MYSYIYTVAALAGMIMLKVAVANYIYSDSLPVIGITAIAIIYMAMEVFNTPIAGQASNLLSLYCKHVMLLHIATILYSYYISC